MKSPTKREHTFRFFRAGGLDQVRIDSGADIAAVAELDQKLWLALSCPVKGLHFDERTLDLLDTDRDGRVRAPEIIAAIRFVTANLKNLDELTRGAADMPLASIKDSSDQGKLLLGSAKRVLAGLGKPDATVISVADVAATSKIFAGTRFNGDGNIGLDSIGDPDAREVAEQIIACVGGELDAAGHLGLTQPKVDAFFADLAAIDDWWQAGASNPAILPLGDATGAAACAVAGVRAKIDDYFARVRLAAFDPRALAAVNRKEDAYLEIAAHDLSISAAEVEGFPLALVEPGRPLPLTAGINPAWADRLTAFLEQAVRPLLGGAPDSLSEQDWAAIKAKLAPYDSWLAAKKGAAVEKIGREKVQAFLAGSAKDNLAKLIAKDKAAEAEMNAIVDVERLVRYYRDLHTLLNNFVSFTDFYRREKAIFQAGDLYLDGRRCELCIQVDNPDQHGVMAVLSKTYIAYVECKRVATGQQMFVAAAFTNGDSDYLMVGRRGLFYDRAGRDWDATIVKLMENPISVRQGFWSPYKKVMRWIEESIAKKAAAADDAATGKLTSAAAGLGDAAATGKPVEKKPKFDVGVVAALGVGVGAITASLTGILNAFFGLGGWMPLGIVGLLLLISGPSMLVAWLKLRQRSLGPILEGTGWAINGRVKVNIPLGGAMTQVAELPAGSERSLVDPYAAKRSIWRFFLPVLLLLVVIGVGVQVAGLYDLLGLLDSMVARIREMMPVAKDG